MRRLAAGAWAMTRLRVVALAATLAAAGCVGDPDYSYYLVDVQIDRDVDMAFLKTIKGCGFVVYHRPEGAPMTVMPTTLDVGTIRCVQGSVGYDVGRVDFSTAVTSGSLQFEALMNDLNGMVIAKGQSALIAIMPGSDQMGTIVATPTAAAKPAP